MQVVMTKHHVPFTHDSHIAVIITNKDNKQRRYLYAASWYWCDYLNRNQGWKAFNKFKKNALLLTEESMCGLIGFEL